MVESAGGGSVAVALGVAVNLAMAVAVAVAVGEAVCWTGFGATIPTRQESQSSPT